MLPRVGTDKQVGVEQELTTSILPVLNAPTCVPGGPFVDITCTTGFDPGSSSSGLDGITAGWGGGKYCPWHSCDPRPGWQGAPWPYRAAFPGEFKESMVRPLRGIVSAGEPK